MKRDLWEAEHTCICGGRMKREKMPMEGLEVRAWKCVKCKEIVLHPEDAQKMLVLNKMKHGIPVKIGELGESLIIRFPKEVAEFYKISKGGEVILKAENKNKLELDLQ
ncbi:MAG TPA: hypothetical protein VJH04_04030 [archaeon]|nr:hypothetical protein [archaeon]